MNKPRLEDLLSALVDQMDHSTHSPGECNVEEIREAQQKLKDKEREVLEELRESEINLFSTLTKRKGSVDAIKAMRALHTFQGKMNDLELNHGEALAIVSAIQLRLKRGVQLCEYEEELKMELRAKEIAYKKKHKGAAS